MVTKCAAQEMRMLLTRTERKNGVGLRENERIGMRTTKRGVFLKNNSVMETFFSLKM